MNQFSQFNIQANNNFQGTKILVDDILNTEIIVQDFKIEPSTKKENTECLHLQFERNGIKHVFFSGSKGLMNQIRQVPKDKLPFKTVIIRENRFLKFT